MYRTGTCAGNNGPTAFIMKGKQRKAGFVNAFLKAGGAAPGLTITMTECVFVIEKVREEIDD